MAKKPCGRLDCPRHGIIRMAIEVRPGFYVLSKLCMICTEELAGKESEESDAVREGSLPGVR